MTTAPGADERRIRHYLTKPPAPDPDAWFDELYAHDEEEQPRAVIPTRVIPAGAPLPDRPPQADDIPPWRTPPPPPAAPVEPAPERPVQVHVTVQQQPYYEPAPTSTWWERVTAGLRWFGRPWQAVGALALAVIPVPWTHYSAAVTWHYCVTQARAAGIPYGYLLAFGTFGLVVVRIARSGGTLLRLWALAVTLVGLFGAMSWYDPITALTGVHK